VDDHEHPRQHVSATVTLARLRPRLEAWVARQPSRPVFAVHHTGQWTGPDQIFIDQSKSYVDVRVCASELAVREALSESREDGRGLVLLTAAEDLGEDVLARCAWPRVYRLHPEDALLLLFDVRSIDPELVNEKWLIGALVDTAPPGGYEPAGSVQLDLARAWRALLGHRHGIDPDAGLAGLLLWACSTKRLRFLEVAESERAATVEWLDRTTPGAAGILAAVRAGAGEDVVALGLVLRVLLAAPESAERVAARTRLEAELQDWTFADIQAGAWARAAESRLLELQDRERNAQQRRADQVIERLQATMLVAYSDHLRAGLRARMALLGQRLDAHLDGKATVEDLLAAVELLRHHHLAGTAVSSSAGASFSGSGAGAAATMALRLARWLALEAAAPQELRAAAASHATGHSYADWARSVLRQGAGEPELDGALRRLVAAADERRETQEERFATLLAAWARHAAGEDALLGVEHVIERVLGPLARQRPVLLIVLDGMSHRVADELLDDLLHDGWTELRRSGQPERALVVSALPSVTALSRTSLLSGTLARGLAADETTAFAAHPALVAAGVRAGAPRLFHKGAITDPRGGLTEELRGEIVGARRVLGVVVNAIDDHLVRSEQLRTPWAAGDILPLRWLLDAARDAGRLVVLASDHGHVLEHGSRLQPSAGESGERWRSAQSPPGDGEIAIEGKRVLAPGGACVLAYSEQIRYAPKKNGYHGGASAQEVLAPLLVLSPGLDDGIVGWEEAAYDPPAWWLSDASAPSEPPVDLLPEPALGDAPAEAPAGEQMTLATHGAGAYSLRSDSASADWIGELLASELFIAQRHAAGRTPVSDERTTQILTALDAHNGRLLRDALARICGIPAMRLTGTLAALRQLLNLDGYPVLTVEEVSGDVKLDRALLALQFDLKLL
jgi:hypothetical protein